MSVLDGEHWGPIESAWPTPQDELADSELGDRVGWWQTCCDLVTVYVPEARPSALAWLMAAQVAEAATAAGAVLPDEWVPAS
jgi:hypothetical protein